MSSERRRDIALFIVAVALVAVAVNKTSDGGAIAANRQIAAPVPLKKPAAVDLLDSDIASKPLKIPGKGTIHALFIGDSLRAGFGATTRSGDYENTVIKALRKKRPVQATDAIARRNGPHGLTFARSFHQIPGGQDLVVIEIGTNDYAKHTDFDFYDDYNKLVHRVRKANPHAVVACLNIWNSATYDPVTMRQFNSTVGDVCRHDAYVDISQFYDHYSGPAGRKTWNGPSDDFHPNDEGHAIIAEAILETVRP